MGTFWNQQPDNRFRELLTQHRLEYDGLQNALNVHKHGLETAQQNLTAKDEVSKIPYRRCFFVFLKYNNALTYTSR